MPWHKVKDHADCGVGKWAVVANGTGEVEGCHNSEDDANRQLAALYTSEDRAAVRHLPGKHNQESHGDGAPGVDVAADKLKLAGRIDLDPGERLVRSDKVDTDFGAVRIATTETDGRRVLRIGIGGPGFGSRDDEAGPWRGGPDPTEAINADRRRLRDEKESLTAELDRLDADPAGDPARKTVIEARLEELDNLDTVDIFPAGYTAKLDEPAARQLQTELTAAIGKAEQVKAREDAFWEAREAEVARLRAEYDAVSEQREPYQAKYVAALEGKGPPLTAGEDAEFDRLQEQWDSLWEQIRRLEDETDLAELEGQGESPFDESQTEGSVGGQWANVLYDVYYDDAEVHVLLGAVPAGSGGNLDDLRDGERYASLTPAEARRVLKLLGPANTDSSRGAATFAPGRFRRPRRDLDRIQTEAWTVEQTRFDLSQARDPEGSATGGQFAADGGGSKEQKPKRRRVMAYDPDRKTGPGYGTKNGDPDVRTLQEALNRLGLTDAKGRRLAVDGKLGPLTTQAVKAAQKRLGVAQDGRVTPELLDKLSKAKKDKRSDDVDGWDEFRRALPDMCVRAFDFAADTGGDGRTLEGYAAVFGVRARIPAVGGDFDEEIAHGAFGRSLRARTPVLQWEHGMDPRVGRVPIGSIDELREDSRGLYVRARLYDNPVVEPIRQAIAGQSVRGMSFRFTVPDRGDRWEPGTRRGGVDLRTVVDADVAEVGPVVFPAYDATTVQVRSVLAAFGEEERRALVRELAAELRLATDLTDVTGRPDARSVGGGAPDRAALEGRQVEQSTEEELRTRDRVLRALGAISG